MMDNLTIEQTGWGSYEQASLPNRPQHSPQAAYVHIPFCRRRCYYCDFPIAVVGDKPPLGGDRINGRNSGTITHYVTVLCDEIRHTPAWGQPLTTVFFGGGTPSLLSVEQLDCILNTLDQQFGIAHGAEISMEVDPGTFDRAQLAGYDAAGVNRLSLGVQAFQPELLAACGRSHTVAEVYAAIDLIQQVGVTNVSLDLISGLPDQTLADWQASLSAAIALNPTHLSCYDLTIEPMTAFGRRYHPGATPLPSDETTAAMYRLAQQILTGAGFEHYEISNYAKPGYQCRHNRVYWENRPFYGFGMGATSYLNGDRLARPRKTSEYYQWVKTIPHPTPDPPPASREELLDTLMLGLRLAEGLCRETLTERFGQEIIEQVWHCLQPYVRNGWVDGSSGERSPSSTDLPPGEYLRLTDPEGFLFSNVILVSLFEQFQ